MKIDEKEKTNLIKFLHYNENLVNKKGGKQLLDLAFIDPSFDPDILMHLIQQIDNIGIFTLASYTYDVQLKIEEATKNTILNEIKHLENIMSQNQFQKTLSNIIDVPIEDAIDYIWHNKLNWIPSKLSKPLSCQKSGIAEAIIEIKDLYGGE